MKTSKELIKVAQNALSNISTQYSVAIFTSPIPTSSPQWGSGTLIEIDGKKFILTCRHVIPSLEAARSAKYSIHRFPLAGPVDYRAIKESPDILSVHPSIKMYEFEILPISQVHFPAKENIDLVLIALGKNLTNDARFFSLNNTTASTPPPGTEIYLTGYSQDTSAKVRVAGKSGIGIFPYTASGTIQDKTIESSDFDAAKHFLIDYPKDDEDLAAPNGMSGAAIWYRLPSGENNLWTANLRIAGIQASYFIKSKMIKAIKIEALKNILVPTK